jgi:DnaJ family protein B protein 4
VLSDQQKRAVYDQYGEEGLKGQVPPPGAGGMPGGATYFSTGGGDGPTAFRFNPRNAEDIFAEFFGSSSPFGGMGGMGGMGGGGGMGGMPGMRSGGIRFSPSMFGGEDAFGSAFGGAGDGHHGMYGGGGRAVKAAPIERKLPCSLEELYKGTTKKMKISREIADASG